MLPKKPTAESSGISSPPSHFRARILNFNPGSKFYPCFSLRPLLLFYWCYLLV